MLLPPGKPAPWFTAASTTNPNYHFESVAGRYVVMCFLKSSSDTASKKVLEDLAHYREVFNDKFCCFFGVSIDPEDQKFSRLQEQIPGIRFFIDLDQNVSLLYKVTDGKSTYHQCTYILDERLRVFAVLSFEPDLDNHVPQLMHVLSQVPEIPPDEPASIQAPILVVPRIFEPELCRALIAHYEQHGGEESGFMREKQGRTVGISDPAFKRRRDQEIVDDSLRKEAMFRIHDRLAPEIHKAFQFKATRIERHIVACYDSKDRGFFNPHRDNTTKGTAHRRFAVSLNLNTGEYEGGLLRFPEFGRKTYTAPAGGAVVFSCSLLHEATPVIAGRRYAYLPFLYDDDAAQVRQANQVFLGEAAPTKGFASKPEKSKKKR